MEVRQLTQADHVALKVIEVEPGRSTPFHTHAHGHEAVIVSGVGALRLEDREEALEPGDVLSVDPDEPYAVVNRGSAVLAVRLP